MMTNSSLNRFYAGIGARKAVERKEILDLCFATGRFLAKRNFVLRSGGAIGCDTSFEDGCTSVEGAKEIFFPSINKHPTANWTEALRLAEVHHKHWYKCSQYARMAHARNCFQILGEDLKTPISFVVCWTPDGCEDGTKTNIGTGGTGQALRVATAFNIPIINIANLGWSDKIKSLSI